MVRPMPRARGAMRQGMAKLAEPKAALRCGAQPGREQQGPMAPRTVVAIASKLETRSLQSTDSTGHRTT